MVFSAMLTDAFRNCEEGIHIRYRTKGKLFNLSRLKAITKVQETVSRDFLFADDCALNARTEKMQRKMDCFSQACDNFGLTSSTKRTDVMYQPAPGKPYQEPCITVRGHNLQAVDNFTYFGLHTQLSRAAKLDAEVNNRVPKARTAFSRLRKNVWERRGLSLTTKLKVYSAVVVIPPSFTPVRPGPCFSRHTRQLDHFHLSCLHRLLHIEWQDKVPDTEVLERAGLCSSHTPLLKAQALFSISLGGQDSCS